MFGYGAQEQLHWSIGFIGYAFIGFGLTTVANIGMTYILDVYSPIADDALLVVNGLKNIFAFGFSYGVSPWVMRAGFGKVSISKPELHVFCAPLTWQKSDLQWSDRHLPCNNAPCHSTVHLRTTNQSLYSS